MSMGQDSSYLDDEVYEGADDSPVIPHGGRRRVDRTATLADESLSASKYARAVANFLADASGEVCVGLFGPWVTVHTPVW